MRIVKFLAENVKKLSTVEITPSGDIVTIAGANGNGKTSILDSIFWCLAGTAGIQSQPIRKGQNKARIKLDMGEIIVERRFTEKGTSLIVETAEGSRFASPQKLLDEMLGALSFDPLAFSRMKPKDQFDELRRMVALDIDIDQLDALNKGDYLKRTDLNREAKAKRAQAEAIPVAGVLVEPIDESAIIDQMESAAEKNNLINQRAQRREQAGRDVQAKLANAQTLRAQAAELRTKADAMDAHAAESDEQADGLAQTLADAAPLPEVVDITDLRAQLDTARAENKKHEGLAKRRQIEVEADALEAKSTDLTEQMAAREKVKADAIAVVKMPVEGLGFGDGLVQYNGVPFDQASSAEQLRVSLAIAMAANPKIRVIRITDGSLLDENSMAIVAEMAAEQDYQVWCEVVDTSGKLGIVIESGEVAKVNL
jgi:energy-coupling factor transporter ATP-binding protein EcfA2